jgi:hypothetical protein
MARIAVQARPKQTKPKQPTVEIEIDDGLTVHLTTIEDWVQYRTTWEFTLHEGHLIGSRNNVEAHLVYVDGEETSSLRFRLDQLDSADDLMGTLQLRFEERDEIAKAAWLTSNGLDVELFHVVFST